MSFEKTGYDGSAPLDFTTRGKNSDSSFGSNDFLARSAILFAWGVSTGSITLIARSIHDFLRRPLSAGRPDADGYLTWREANDWHRNGNGMPVYVDLSKINLKGISPADFGNKIGKKDHFNLLFGKSHSFNDGLVYGTITLRYLGNGKVEAVKNDTYNFDPKPWDGIGSVVRNIETIIGKWNVEVGQGFKIHFRGQGTIGK